MLEFRCRLVIERRSEVMAATCTVKKAKLNEKGEKRGLMGKKRKGKGKGKGGSATCIILPTR